MPAQYGATDLTATGRYAITVDRSGGPGDNIGTLSMGDGTFTGTATLQANVFTADEDPTDAGWVDIQGQNQTTGVWETVSVTTNTQKTYQFNALGFAQVAFNVTAITGTIPFNLLTYVASSAPGAIAGATEITSTSADSLSVGPDGTTNPTLQVDASTTDAATGVKIKSAAEGAGVAVSVISSTTNEALTIDAKGSGTVTINGTGTGNVVIGANLAITDAKNVVLATTTGTSLGSATTQKLSFYGVTPITQPAASSAVSVTGTTGASTGVSLDTTFTGGGTAAFTIGGIVTRLKALGLLAA